MVQSRKVRWQTSLTSLVLDNLVDRVTKMTMIDQNLFSKGFPTNRIPVTIPSTGQSIVMRETTIIELKSMCKTVIDNFDRR